MADRSRVVGVVGLPGSGKSALMRGLVANGFRMHDDIFEQEEQSIAAAREDIAAGQSIVVSDIVLCRAEERARLATLLDVPIEWQYFANDPWQCAVNCLYRTMVELDDRPLLDMLHQIALLSPHYKPEGQLIAVPVADARLRRGAATPTV
jgi:ABC-type dipeptide/oligopeptide/nickel transport system ATPase component